MAWILSSKDMRIRIRKQQQRQAGFIGSWEHNFQVWDIKVIWTWPISVVSAYV